MRYKVHDIYWRIMIIRRVTGFTLVELMVVIAIIGLFAAIVISSLGSARTKSADSAAKQNLTQIRTSAELLYDTYNDYDKLCSPGYTTEKLYEEAFLLGSKVPGTAYCLSSGSTYLFADVGGIASSGDKAPTPNQWAATIQLKNGLYFCVDYLGNATTSPTLRAAPGHQNCN